MAGIFGHAFNLMRMRSKGTPLNKTKLSLTPQNNTEAATTNGETSPVSVGLLSLHTTQKEASKNLEKKRKFSEVEGTQGQVILG